jgi:hypothetical protein
MKLDKPCAHSDRDAACAELPDLRRLNYFYGQMLGVNDFRTEQAFFREKLKLHNRCLHGYGTVCGLLVTTVPPPQECRGEDDVKRQKLQAELDALRRQLEQARSKNDETSAKQVEERIALLQQRLDKLPPAECAPPAPARVVVECGMALDCEGNEIIVPRPYAFDPWSLLTEHDRKKVQDSQGTDLYLSICYCEQPVDPVRPVLPDACGATPDCTHGKLRDSFSLRLTTQPPPRDTRCEPCCSGCQEACLLLAVLRGYRKGEAPAAVDNGVRRLVSTYPATTITGISWTQGATYSIDAAAEILGWPGSPGSGGSPAAPGSPGIQVNFSRPVLSSTLTDGVVQLWVIEGGRTRAAGVYFLEGRFEDFAGADTVDSFRFTYQGDEGLDPGDQLMVTIRCAFILDECCRPVDGAHVGGRVPLIAGFERFDRSTPHAQCERRPPGYGPWTSGAGTPGASFEGWFFVEQGKEGEKRRGTQESRK